MMSSNSKLIEDKAIVALKKALLNCKYIDSYIDSNDKTPMWDGTIFAYNSENHKKSNFNGRIPIQVKGTSRIIKGDTTAFSCNFDDLHGYYVDGGCLFFLVSVDKSKDWSNIYYANLLTYDLAKIKKEAEGKKSHTIKLKRFPSDDGLEIANICYAFIKDSRKQSFLSDKGVPTLAELEKSGTEISDYKIEATTIGVHSIDIDKYITTHDFYLYAIPKNMEIGFPIEKVSNAIISKTVKGKVSIAGRTYYSEYKIVTENGNRRMLLGRSIHMDLPDAKVKKATISFKATGTLADYIKDTEFILSLVKTLSLCINGADINLSDIEGFNIFEYEKKLKYYQDVKAMLDALGVKEELQCASLTGNDEKNIRNFVNAILYNRKIGFPGMKETTLYGMFNISNLKIMIWADKCSDGNYRLSNFFDKHPMALFRRDDKRQENPIPASHFLLITKEALISASNLDLKTLLNDISKTERSVDYLEQVQRLMLTVLSSYDDCREGTRNDLLKLAANLCKWIDKDNLLDDERQLLNRLQIKKRISKLTKKDKTQLEELLIGNSTDDIKCAAYLLLDNDIEAKEAFKKMPSKLQKEFLDYPICHFGNLKNND